jgi:cytochrome P450
MIDIVTRVTQKRIQSGERKTDILDLMLNAVDNETGEKLPLENIYDQLITFLIAG